MEKNAKQGKKRGRAPAKSRRNSTPQAKATQRANKADGRAASGCGAEPPVVGFVDAAFSEDFDRDRKWLEPWRALWSGDVDAEAIKALEEDKARLDALGDVAAIMSFAEFSRELLGEVERMRSSTEGSPPRRGKELAARELGDKWRAKSGRAPILSPEPDTPLDCLRKPTHRIVPIGSPLRESIEEERDAIARKPSLRRLLSGRLGERTEEFALVVLGEHFRLAFCKSLHRDLLERRESELSDLIAWKGEELEDQEEKRRRELENFNPAREGSRFALAAPRGAAKSSFVSFLFPLHDFLYGLERYIVILSATFEQAAKRLDTIRAALADNPAIAYLYPQFAGRRAPAILESNRRTLRAAHCRVDALSAGMELRGISDRSWRPTKIVLDDAEASACARSAKRRAKLAEWLAEVVEPLGDSYTRIEIAGTILDRDSLLADVLKRPSYTPRIYRSITTPATNQQLWAEWGTIFHDPAQGPEKARAFFAEREAEMREGSEVLWPEKEDYLALMEIRETIGRRAFEQEKQNDPSREGEALFASASVRWFSVGTREGVESLVVEAPRGEAEETVTRSSLAVVAFLDSATGTAKSGKGDDAAIAVVGASGDGRYFALHVWMKPAPPHEQIEQAWALHELHRFDALGFESNVFQGLLAIPFEEERKRRAAANEPCDLVARPVPQTRKKELRIGALEPLVQCGRLLLRKSLPERFLAQFERYPNTEHDDGLDALAGAVELARALAREKSAKKERAPIATVQRGRDSVARTASPRILRRPGR